VDAHVLIPLKRLDSAKSRLAESLSAADRAELMHELLEHVVATVRQAAVGPVTIVSPEPSPLAGVPRFDDQGMPWNEALATAMEALVTERVATVVAADLPLVTAEEICRLVAATPARGVAIGRALDGGTNAISMRPPGAYETCFGTPGSAAVHERTVWLAGGSAHTLDLPGLAFDVDTPEDLAAWRQT
jgi:2-phospho-L-lactate guanylyltransferase